MTRLGQGGAGAEELELRQSQCLGFWSASAELEIKLFHQLGGCLILYSPQARHRRLRACRQQRATESLNTLALDQFPALGVACRQRGQLHAPEIQRVYLFEEQIVRRFVIGRWREEDAAALGVVLIRRRSRAQVPQRDPLRDALEEMLLEVGCPEIHLGAAGTRVRDRLDFFRGLRQSPSRVARGQYLAWAIANDRIAKGDHPALPGPVPGGSARAGAAQQDGGREIRHI